jgi:hypothetical protein
MVPLAREITLAIVLDYGPDEVLRRLSDPFWFQAFGCVLGFDWHSSGVTTTACGALKEGLRGLESETGLFVAGGKGGTSRRTPAEIHEAAPDLAVEPDGLEYASRMSAKVDSAALQDGYQIYHHTFVFTKEGSWAVIQQGMNDANGYARRYHWLSQPVNDFVNEPHAAISSQGFGATLNLVASESEAARRTIAWEVREEKPEKLLAELKKLKTLDLPRRHHVELKDINPDRIAKTLLSSYDRQPEDFQTLLSLKGVGPKTMRALSLIAELVYGSSVSVRDPARFSFAHGGKDGHPYPVDRPTYDRSIEILGNAVRQAKIDRREKMDALRRLTNFQSVQGGQTVKRR